MASKLNSGKSLTRFQFREINFSWTLENFSICNKKPKEKVESQIFPKLETDKCEWRLWLYPYGDSDESKDYVSIFLVLIPTIVNSTLAQCKYSFQDIDGKVIHSDHIVSEFQPTTVAWGTKKFIKHSDLIPQLKNDVLVVKCSVKWQENVIHETVTCSNDAAEVAAKPEVQSNLSNDYHQLMRKGAFNDVYLLAKDDVKIPAHKCILAARSPIFATLLQRNANEQRKIILEFNDVNANVLKSVLEFIYSGRFDNDQCRSEELLAAAEKYALEDLKVLCELELCKTLKVENAVDYLLLSDRHKAKILKEKVLKLITTNFKDILKTDAMKNLTITQTSVFYELLEAVADKIQG